MIALLRKAADRLIGLSAIIGTFGLIVEVSIIILDVVGRAFHAPVRGAQDVSQMSMVLIVFGGMALCDKLGGHVSVDVFERHYPEWLNRAIDIFAALLGAVIFCAIAWSVHQSALLSQLLNLSTNIIHLPKAWFQWAISALSIVTALGMAMRATELALGGPRTTSEPEADL